MHKCANIFLFCSLLQNYETFCNFFGKNLFKLATLDFRTASRVSSFLDNVILKFASITRIADTEFHKDGGITSERLTSAKNVLLIRGNNFGRAHRVMYWSYRSPLNIRGQRDPPCLPIPLPLVP